jgi:hypothetical protein
MSSHHRRYLVLEQGIGAGLFNVVLNAAIAWLLFRGMTTVPLWGAQSIGGDTIGTTFFLPLLTTLIASRVVRGHVRRGRVAALAWSDAGLTRRLPTGLALRGTVLGVLCLLLVGLPTMQALAAAGVVEMGFGRFVTFKALFAGALAVIVTPIVACAALADGTSGHVDATTQPPTTS